MLYIEKLIRFLFVLIAFCVAAFAAIIYSGSANNWIADNISLSLTEASGLPVKVVNAHIEFPLKIAADRVIVGALKSPVFNAEQISMDCNIHELMRGKFVVRNLDIGSLMVHSLPSTSLSQTDQQFSPAKAFSINELYIHDLQASNELQSVLSQELGPLAASAWQIQGSLQMDGNSFIKSAFHIYDIDHVSSFEGTIYGIFNNLDIAGDFYSRLFDTYNLSALTGKFQLKTEQQNLLGNIQASFSIENIPSSISSNLSYAANQLNLSEIVIETPYGFAYGHLLFSTSEKWLEGEIKSDIDLETTLNDDIKGTASIELHFSPDPVAPATLHIASPVLETALFSLKGVLFDATLAGLSPKAHFNAHTSVEKILFPQLPIEGTLSAQGSLEGPLSEPTGKFIIDLSKISSTDERLAHHPPLDGSIHVALADGRLSCSGQAASMALPACEFASNIPFHFSLAPFQFQINRQDEIAGHLNVQGDLTTVLQLFFPDFTMLSGNMTASGTVSGSLDTPHYYTTMEIKEGGFEIGASGTVLKNLDAQLVSDGKMASLTRLNATDGFVGKVSGRGGIVFDSVKNHPFFIDLDIENSVLWQQDYTSATFNGQLTFSGNTLEGRLAGTTTCTKAEIVIPDSNDALVDTLEVIYINQPEGVLPPPTLIASPSWPLVFDIAINAPETISVTGQELESIWKGKLTVSGSTAAPLLFGDFKVVEGYYMFNGKNFSLDQGTVSIAGDIDKKTNLYVIAAKDLGKVKVEVIMKGSLKNPEISFRSNPPMSQREILSWILFNRGTSEISHFQGSQLRESITNLSNTHKGPDVLTKIRNALGIDRLEICKGGPGDSESMGVQVGKYISQNVYVSINKSDVNRLAVEAALREHIKLQAEIGDDAEGNLMLKWKRDY